MLQVHPQVPFALDALDQLGQAAGEAVGRRRRPPRRRLQLLDEEAEVALLGGDQALHLGQPLAALDDVLVEQAAGGGEPQGDAGERLQRAVVEVAGEADALLGGRQLEQPPGEEEVVEAAGGDPGDDLGEDQVVGGHPRAVEEEQAALEGLAGEGDRQHRAGGEAGREIGVEQAALVPAQSASPSIHRATGGVAARSEEKKPTPASGSATHG